MLASGGAAIEPELARRLEGLGWKVAVGYGLTETSPLLALTRPGEGALETVGKPVPETEIRIDPSAHPAEEEGEEGSESGDREEGEILARGPGVFRGYRNLPDKTDEAFTDDGWFRTGDLGYMDDDGYLHVTGRVSTLIVMPGGENIQPDRVEAAYAERPELREVGVLQQEDTLVALVVPDPRALRERDEDVEEAVRRAVEERGEELPSYQRVSDYAVTREALPRTRLGKIRRGELEERWERAQRGEEAEHEGPMDPREMTGEDRSLLDDEAARTTWELLAERYPDQRLTPDTSPQLDLGIDSLDWVELTLEIGDRAGVELGEEALGRAESVRDLLREVAEQRGGGAAANIDPLAEPEEVLTDRQKRWLRPLGRREAVAARALHRTARGLMRAVYRLSVQGAENLPESGPFILAPNHVSYLDPVALAAALDYEVLRQSYWGSFSGAFHRPVLRTVSRLAQAVPVERERGASSSLAFAAAVLDRGDNLIWFPEGTRSDTGELQDLKRGIGRLLDHFRVPVVPVHLSGTHEALRPGSLVPRLTRITVVIGEPAEADDLEREGSGEDADDRILDALRERMEELGRTRV